MTVNWRELAMLESPLQDLIKTESPNIFCSTVPTHWRSNKSLPHNFRVLVMDDVKDGTAVTIRVGNDENLNGELRNNSSTIKDQIALFNDLRFIGRSGRGKSFSLSIIVHSKPAMITNLTKAIKITVDGPREPRNKTRSSGWGYPFLNPWVDSQLSRTPGAMPVDPQLALISGGMDRGAASSNWWDIYRLNLLQSSMLTPQVNHQGIHHHYSSVAAALAGLAEPHRGGVAGLQSGRCHQCRTCESGLGPCVALTSPPEKINSSPPHTPSPPSRTSPSSSTTPSGGRSSSSTLRSLSPISGGALRRSLHLSAFSSPHSRNGFFSQGSSRALQLSAVDSSSSPQSPDSLSDGNRETSGPDTSNTIKSPSTSDREVNNDSDSSKSKDSFSKIVVKKEKLDADSLSAGDSKILFQQSASDSKLLAGQHNSNFKPVRIVPSTRNTNSKVWRPY